MLIQQSRMLVIETMTCELQGTHKDVDELFSPVRMLTFREDMVEAYCNLPLECISV